jgi:hypothetical protein
MADPNRFFSGASASVSALPNLNSAIITSKSAEPAPMNLEQFIQLKQVSLMA